MHKAALYRSLLSCIACLLAFPTGGHAQNTPTQDPTGPKKARRVRVLIVGDTLSNLNKPKQFSGVTIPGAIEDDIAEVRFFFETAFENNKEELAIIAPVVGTAVSPSGILQAVQSIAATPDEAIFFYYTGHGKIENGVHGFTLTTPDPDGNKFLPRKTVIDTLVAKRPALLVLATDCCADIVSAPPPTGPQPCRQCLVSETPFYRVARSLFLQHRGLVDINSSSPGQYSWQGDGGGLFTAAFLGVGRKGLQAIDPTPGDGFIHWHEYFPQVAKETQAAYDGLRDSVKSQLEGDDVSLPPYVHLKKQLNQTVWTTSLTPYLRLGVRVTSSTPEGPTVAEVYPSASADGALQVGDIITEIAGKTINSEEGFAAAIDSIPSGQMATIGVKRKSMSPSHVTITLK